MATKSSDKTSEFDISSHILVSKHEKISAKEREKVFKEFNATPGQLPRILITDPAIQALGPEEGDLIKITRESRTAGQTTFYRIVVTE